MTASPGTALDEREIAYAGVIGQSTMLRDGLLSSTELVEVLLRRIERLQPRLNPFRLVFAGGARRAAAEADEARRAGDRRPLLGVPIAIKDNVGVAGHSAMLGTGSPEPPAADDDEIVRRLRAAGMVLIGTTHLPELAMWAATESSHHGVTRNPWDLTRAPGGSSGGSAVAVAAGLAPVAYATDGLGSIRIPASSCGLVGLKPTHALVPMGPDPDHWLGLSHAGFLTRSVEDTAVLLDAVVEPSPRFTEALAHGLDRSLRVAVSVRPVTPGRVDPVVRDVFDAAVARIGALGHTVVLRDPPYGNALPHASTVRYLAGVAVDVGRLADPRATEARTRALARMGRLLPARAVAWARRQGSEFADRMQAFFADVDLLVTPTMPLLPVPAGSIVGRGVAATLRLMVPRASFTAPWNSSGLPAMSLPVGATRSGLPIGLQVVGPAGSEALLLQLGAALERELRWTERRPPID